MTNKILLVPSQGRSSRRVGRQLPRPLSSYNKQPATPLLKLLAPLGGGVGTEGL